MLTELARGIVGGVAGLVGVKPRERAVRSGAEHEETSEPSGGSLAGTVAAEVGTILETARDSAERIVAEARLEAARIVADARREVANGAHGAGQVDRAQSVEEREAPPRTGNDDDAVEIAVDEDAGETLEVPPSVAIMPEQPAVSGDPPSGPEDRESDLAPRAAEAAREPEQEDEERGAGEGPRPQSTQSTARLVAMNLALGGATRTEIVAQVETELGPVEGLDAILDEVLARAG